MNIASLVSDAVLFVVVLIAITFHEAAHAFAARNRGDDTAAKLGRASLNPLRHIDLIGTILVPLALYYFNAPVLFGWAKPVPVAWSRLGHWRSGMALVAIAGPAANFALAGISWLVMKAFENFGFVVLANALAMSVAVNLFLGAFNLIPIPPLDGSKVLASLLPAFMARALTGFPRKAAQPADADVSPEQPPQSGV